MGFRWAKIGLAYSLNGSVVMIPYLCNRASYTSITPLVFSGAGRLWLYAVVTSMGVSFTLESLLIPMSNQCLAKMSLNWTNNSSMDAFVCWSSVESVELEFDMNWSLDFWFACGSSFSNSSSAYNSLRIRFCMGVWSLGLPGFCGVGIQ